MRFKEFREVEATASGTGTTVWWQVKGRENVGLECVTNGSEPRVV